MHIFSVIIFSAAAAVIVIILTVAAFVKKKKFALAAAGVTVLAWAAFCVYQISENEFLKAPQPETTVLARFSACFAALRSGTAFEPHDPCKGTAKDGPVVIPGTTSTQYLYYSDYVLVLPHRAGSTAAWILNPPAVDYIFSLPKAAHAFRNTLLSSDEMKKISAGGQGKWIIQFTGVSSILEETAYMFAAGYGDMDLTCPKFFNIAARGAVSQTFKVYESHDTPKFITSVKRPDEEITRDRDFGLDITGLDISPGDAPLIPL